MAKVGLPLVHRALKRAVKAHKKQDRDGEFPLPYATHPVDVLNLVRYDGGVTDEELLAAALLHDVVEETDLTVEDVAAEFGTRVARIVKELTREEPDRTGLSPEEIWQIRTQTMLDEIDRMSDEAKIVKLADRASNLRAALLTRSGEALNSYIRQSHLILAHIDRSVCPVLWDRVKDLAAAVAVPERTVEISFEDPLEVG
ncbi:MAG TPA: HD domain-containing protein [Fimbriimonadaceae bacterium]|nr:HD domain-containing protein [Fimbriimonadaceae bacterium]